MNEPRKITIAEALALMAPIAAALTTGDETWTAVVRDPDLDPNPQWSKVVYLERWDGARVTVNVKPDAERYVFHGDFWYGGKWLSNWIPSRDFNNGVTSITVSASKTPEKIAAEIRRRLLPDFLSLRQVGMDRYLASMQEAERGEALAKYLLEVAGSPPTWKAKPDYRHQSSADPPYYWILEGDGAYDRFGRGISVTCKRAEITLSLPPNEAEQLFKFMAVRGWFAPRKETQGE